MNNYISWTGFFMLLKMFRTNQVAKNKIRKMDKKNLFLVDVRQPDEFRGGNVKESVNIPLGEITKRIGEFKNKENIVVFCRSGNRSAQAAAILKQNGISNVTNGGTWQNVAAIVQ